MGVLVFSGLDLGEIQVGTRLNGTARLELNFGH